MRHLAWLCVQTGQGRCWVFLPFPTPHLLPSPHLPPHPSLPHCLPPPCLPALLPYPAMPSFSLARPYHHHHHTLHHPHTPTRLPALALPSPPYCLLPSLPHHPHPRPLHFHHVSCLSRLPLPLPSPLPPPPPMDNGRAMTIWQGRAGTIGIIR